MSSEEEEAVLLAVRLFEKARSKVYEKIKKEMYERVEKVKEKKVSFYLKDNKTGAIGGGLLMGSAKVIDTLAGLRFISKTCRIPLGEVILEYLAGATRFQKGMWVGRITYNVYADASLLFLFTLFGLLGGAYLQFRLKRGYE